MVALTPFAKFMCHKMVALLEGQTATGMFFSVNPRQKAVAVRGAMWGHPKKLENCIFPGFSLFWAKPGKKAVALCGATWRYPKKLENCIFPVFSFLGKTWKKGCGTMWRYVALSQKA